MQTEANGPSFDKYEFYQRAVQSPEQDAEFLAQAYWDIRHKEPKVMREDFCAAFALCCAWVQRNPTAKAVGIDLDQEPLNYGREHYLAGLPQEAQERVCVIKGDVLDDGHPQADLICALNFSYMGFKQREDLKAYFASCYRSLPDDGVMIVDCFGGSDTQSPNEHETEYDKFSYFWDQDTFNPLTNEAKFYIHFKRKGERKRTKVFSYDWRLWSLAELKDLFAEAGFSKTVVYWEGTDDEGDGNGVFTPTQVGEDCESWVAYVVAAK